MSTQNHHPKLARVYTHLHPSAHGVYSLKVLLGFTQVLEGLFKRHRQTLHPPSQKGSNATWKTCSTVLSEQSELSTDTNLSDAGSRELGHGVGRARQAGKEQAGSGG